MSSSSLLRTIVVGILSALLAVGIAGPASPSALSPKAEATAAGAQLAATHTVRITVKKCHLKTARKAAKKAQLTLKQTQRAAKKGSHKAKKALARKKTAQLKADGVVTYCVAWAQASTKLKAYNGLRHDPRAAHVRPDLISPLYGALDRGYTNLERARAHLRAAHSLHRVNAWAAQIRRYHPDQIRSRGLGHLFHQFWALSKHRQTETQNLIDAMLALGSGSVGDDLHPLARGFERLIGQLNGYQPHGTAKQFGLLASALTRADRQLSEATPQLERLFGLLEAEPGGKAVGTMDPVRTLLPLVRDVLRVVPGGMAGVSKVKDLSKVKGMSTVLSKYNLG